MEHKGKHFALPLLPPSKRMRSPSDKYNCCCFVTYKIEENIAKQNFADLPRIGCVGKLVSPIYKLYETIELHEA